MGTVVVLAILAGVVALIVRKMIKDKKTDAQPASGHTISCTPSGSGTASNPWHAPDAHPVAGHGESAAMG